MNDPVMHLLAEMEASRQADFARIEEVARGIDRKVDGVVVDVAEVKVQATRTNGRVTGLELREARELGRRELREKMAKWFAGVLSAVVAALLVASSLGHL